MRRQLDRRWKARALVPVFVFAAGSLLLAGCGSSATSVPCTMKQMVATLGHAGTTGSATTLPPSHDNDAGRGRIPDARPDADVDANQREALCKAYRSEIHLPG